MQLNTILLRLSSSHILRKKDRQLRHYIFSLPLLESLGLWWIRDTTPVNSSRIWTLTFTNTNMMGYSRLVLSTPRRCCHVTNPPTAVIPHSRSPCVHPSVDRLFLSNIYIYRPWQNIQFRLSPGVEPEIADVGADGITHYTTVDPKTDLTLLRITLSLLYKKAWKGTWYQFSRMNKCCFCSHSIKKAIEKFEIKFR